jgi:hypothetical protein
MRKLYAVYGALPGEGKAVRACFEVTPARPNGRARAARPARPQKGTPGTSMTR